MDLRGNRVSDMVLSFPQALTRVAVDTTAHPAFATRASAGDTSIIPQMGNAVNNTATVNVLVNWATAAASMASVELGLSIVPSPSATAETVKLSRPQQNMPTKIKTLCIVKPGAASWLLHAIERLRSIKLEVDPNQLFWNPQAIEPLEDVE